MDQEKPQASSSLPTVERLAKRHRGARICAIICLILVLVLAAVSLVLIDTNIAGCWGGAYLFLICLVVLGVPILILLVTVACLRFSELLWLGAAIAVTYFIVEVISSMLPPVLCSGSG
jgi:cytochrome bd-type quinol oxidase subunit 2